MNEDKIIELIEKQLDKYEVPSWDYSDLSSDIEFLIYTKILPELLSDFLFSLNKKGLINNHDFDYEKEVKKFIEKL